MNRTTKGFVKGMGAGMAMGIVASVAGTVLYQNNKKAIKKKASKAVKAMGSFVQDMQGAMKS